MKVSSFTNDREDLLAKLDRWFSQTPERSLEQAYQAALKIKSIEDEHFNGGKITADSPDRTDYLLSFVRGDFEKELNVAKLKLAEFKASRFVVGGSLSPHSTKLKFVDEVLAKYLDRPDSSAALVPSPTEELGSDKVRGQSHSVTLDVVGIKADSQKKSFLPNSLKKTLGRVKKELNPNSEAEVVKNFHTSRSQTNTAIKFLLVLILLPMLTQQVSKHFLVAPIVDHLRNEPESQAFLNSEMKEEALKELQKFEEDLKFEKLLNKTPEVVSPEILEEKVKQKADAIVKLYHIKSNDAVSNVFADLLAAGAFAAILLTRKKDVLILKSFMGRICGDLSDSAKAFILILGTDIFVGFHSPHGWEVILEGLASHLGIPANRNIIFLFIATVPVVLDSVFKYWIFRYMSKLSPSTVATMRNMNE
jgi:hypothetical protein